MSQWTVVVPLEAIKLSEPDSNIFIEAGNVLDGIELPASEQAAEDHRVRLTCNGETYECGRWDLEVCARPAISLSTPR
jgi:hypothetical protein